MGIGGISIWQLLIILAIVVLLFGTKKLKGIGGDLGGAVKGFKKAVSDDDQKAVEDSKSADDAIDPEDTVSEKKETSESK